MPVKATAAAAPDEPPLSLSLHSPDLFDLDEVAIERTVQAMLDDVLYGDEYPDRFRPPLPSLTEAERHEVARRLRAARDRRNRSYRFVCSKAAAARRAGGAR